MANTEIEVSIADILNAANRYYPNRYLAKYFDGNEPVNMDTFDDEGDVLAQVLTRILARSLPEYTDPEERISRAEGILERMKSDVERAIEGLDEFSNEFYDAVEN